MHILIIEDDRSTAEALSLLVCAENTDVKCSVAHNIVEAMAELRRDLPDVIIMDYWLGDEFPDEFVAHVRNTYKHPPMIILMTAARGAEEIAERLKISKLLKKPFGYEELRKLLHR